MKNRLIIGLALVLSLSVLAFFINQRGQTEISSIDRLLKYKNSYVGDNSAVGNILAYANLEGSRSDLKGYSLKTGEEPYGIEINYGIKANRDQNEVNEYWADEKSKAILLYNLTALFALVKNVDFIKLNLDGEAKRTLTVSRGEMEQFYGKDLRSFAASEAKWNEEIIVKTINSSDRVNEFYVNYGIIK